MESHRKCHFSSRKIVGPTCKYWKLSNYSRYSNISTVIVSGQSATQRNGMLFFHLQSVIQSTPHLKVFKDHKNGKRMLKMGLISTVKYV